MVIQSSREKFILLTEKYSCLNSSINRDTFVERKNLARKNGFELTMEFGLNLRVLNDTNFYVIF